ncbi:MAG TPA: DUF456 domain-containing protein [Nocardioidaceae bacterium]|nr:DUF456 domain-containing protein [Nocardioidaceae bacterium]
MDLTELIVGLVILVGLAGIVVPVLPGSILILGAVLVWATEDRSGTAWVVFAVATTLLVVGAIVKYAVPGRRLKSTGVPNRSIMLGGLLGIVGFFVVPVIGLFAGFVLGVYLAEYHRVGRGLAWPSTRAALRAVGVSILIELAAALLASAAWLVGAILT